MRYICSTVALLLSLPLGVLSAQDTLTLAPGARVRVTAPAPDCEQSEARFCPRREVGTLVSIDSLRIVLNDAKGIRREFPRRPYTHLELSAGSGACGGRRGECVVLGLFGGAALGAAVGFISVQSQGGPKQCGENLCELIYAFTIPGGALVGMIVGGVVGAEHWRAVDSPIRVGFAPVGPGRWAFGLTAHF
jgi:hypothetical protein